MGYPSAQFNLGLLYANGKGCAVNSGEAVHWYRKAAKQNNITAQLNLGIAYENGEGIDSNMREAAYWYERAAENGDYYAQGNLARLYAEGLGVEKNLEKAYCWYRLSRKGEGAVIPTTDADPCEALMEQMSEKQLAAAEHWVENWKPKPRKELLPIFQVTEKLTGS